MQNVYRPKVYLSRKQKKTPLLLAIVEEFKLCSLLKSHTHATQLKSYTILHHHKKFPNNSLCFEKKSEE